jgi:hypothetical protein
LNDFDCYFVACAVASEALVKSVVIMVAVFVPADVIDDDWREEVYYYS